MQSAPTIWRLTSNVNLLLGGVMDLKDTRENREILCLFKEKTTLKN